MQPQENNQNPAVNPPNPPTPSSPTTPPVSMVQSNPTQPTSNAPILEPATPQSTPPVAPSVPTPTTETTTPPSTASNSFANPIAVQPQTTFSSSVSSNSSSKKPLIIGLSAVGLLILSGIAAAIYFFMFMNKETYVAYSNSEFSILAPNNEPKKAPLEALNILGISDAKAYVWNDQERGLQIAVNSYDFPSGFEFTSDIAKSFTEGPTDQLKQDYDVVTEISSNNTSEPYHFAVKAEKPKEDLKNPPAFVDKPKNGQTYYMKGIIKKKSSSPNQWKGVGLEILKDKDDSKYTMKDGDSKAKKIIESFNIK